jgi:hypothetical protein
MTGAHGLRRTRVVAAACLAAVIVAILAVTACREGMPIVNPGERPPTVDGTISGTVRGPEGTTPVTGREVQVVNIATGERQRAVTSNVGGFTFKVKPGKYRVEVALIAGESILKQPGVMNVNRSDVDAHADFVIGAPKVSRPRTPGSRTSTALGPPIA